MKSDWARFLKKYLGGSQMGEIPHFWGTFDVFCPYLKNGCNNFDEIVRLNSQQWYLKPRENRMLSSMVFFLVKLFLIIYK